MTKSDSRLKEDIEEELRWDPKVNAAQIAVSVDKGAVSLLGAVDSYAAKWAAEDATKRVSGVRAVAQDLTVKLEGDHKRTDAEIGLSCTFSGRTAQQGGAEMPTFLGLGKGRRRAG